MDSNKWWCRWHQETKGVIEAVKCSGSSDVAGCLRKTPAADITAVEPVLERGLGYFAYPRQEAENFGDVKATVVDGVIIEKAPVEYDDITFLPDKPINLFLSGTAEEIVLNVTITNLETLKNHLNDNFQKFEKNTETAHFGDSGISDIVNQIVDVYNVAEGQSNMYYYLLYNRIAI